ncbi:ornithine decarboxylase [Streptomyces albireticuli]|uniref:Ornithine decarboxylase n=1 Tax=Streptomyces albireticuli TaxID=1940 RepID=A0A1Z2KUY4_9ACTN|nr:ornithine decarboxylase [Streptomyces albireticuli]
MEHLNLGGGLPGTYRTDVSPVEAYAHVILTAVDHHFPHPHQPRLVLEPGRAVVADAGITVTSVKAVVDRSCGTYVVLDTGLYNAGLLDNLGGIEYRVTFPGHPEGAATRPVTLCGPTCDSLDTFTADNVYHAPLALAPGDRGVIWSTGAYRSTSTLVSFNGYPPVPQYTHVPRSDVADRVPEKPQEL